MKNLIKVSLGLLFAVVGFQANALVLENWNDVDLDASGDFITVNTGTVDGNDWFSMQWQAGAGNTLGALGIDTVFYNFTSDFDSTGDVLSVWEGSIGGTDVTGDWSLNFGGDTGGGGFGELSSSKNLDAGGTSGIDPGILFFVLNGDVDFINNGDPTFATFSAHVRYEEDCSGWVSDGNTLSTDSGSCGRTTVPEPGVLALLAIGLLGLALRSRKKIG